MDRTFVCNLGKLVLQRRVDRRVNGDDSLETINLAGAPLGRAAIGAMLGCDLAMADGDRNPTERQLLVVGVDPHRHRCARGPFQTAATEVLYGAHSELSGHVGPRVTECELSR
jgi:hypothetical protein